MTMFCPIIRIPMPVLRRRIQPPSFLESVKSSREQHSDAAAILVSCHGARAPSRQFAIKNHARNSVRAQAISGAAPTKMVHHRMVHVPDLPEYEEWIEGAVMLVDKPKGWTSFDVCGKLRGCLKKIGIKKVGHAGTLDPMATGLLIVCAGKATKQVDNYQAMDKVYTGTMKLGEGTPSYDAESEVEERMPWEHITDEQIVEAASTFIGDIEQEPPMFSAIKIGGEALYKKARRGETVERKLRPVNIAEFKTWRDDPASPNVHFEVECSKGTYIRSLAFDLGRKLGSTAHLTALRREKIGEHSVENAWPVLDLAEGIIKQRDAAADVQERIGNS